MPLLTALWRQEAEVKQVSEFEASLVYRLSSRIARAIHTEKPCLKQNKNKQYNLKREKRRGKLGPGDEGGQRKK